ncbi:7-carboxy-7-deazaguanine synthase QueE [Streptomyces sp. NPDC050161]|uniref:7-carboxy-7-deazaguanine synthase QueE n=1 Tax=Streptomyces sp. NPDC050161 TaxID=3365604 RepID=UPI0037A48F2C
MTDVEITLPSAADTLPVTEKFAGTFQGEGPSTGVGAMFVRFAGCNESCRGCDTPYTWDASRFDLRRESRREVVGELLAWALGRPEKLVVLTGGEPLLHRHVVPLTLGLRAAGKDVEFETNGTLVPPRELVDAGVRFNVSPKLSVFGAGMPHGKRIVPAALRAFQESGLARFKFVVKDPSVELAEISALETAYGLDPVWVMPEGTTADAVLAGMRALAGPVSERGWHLSTRLHVLIWGDERGR